MAQRYWSSISSIESLAWFCPNRWLKAVRSSAGEALVLDENMFIEKMLPGVTQRTLAAEEMAEYRRPFLEAGDDRWPTLQWPREVPLSGEPADVHDRIAAYSAWLKTASRPKLFIDAEPGVLITGRIRRLASSFPNQHRVVVGGLHFVQEDSPDEDWTGDRRLARTHLTDLCSAGQAALRCARATQSFRRSAAQES
jgi:hypothetical protein